VFYTSRPMVVELDGRTDLHNWYPEPGRFDRAKMPKGGGTGAFTVKRTARSLRAVLELHGSMASRGSAYFVTLTSPPSWSAQARREGLRNFLDRLRKCPGYMGHVWVTELHGGVGLSAWHGGPDWEGVQLKRCIVHPLRLTRRTNFGTIHHHVLIRFGGTSWVYRNSVVEWSRRYTGSVNGLDVRRIGKGGVSYYMGKVTRYMKKAGARHALPFRWWGTSRIARRFVCSQEAPWAVFVTETRPWRRGRFYRARICGLVARAECRALTLLFEARRMNKRRLREIRARRRKKRQLAPIERTP